MPYQDPRQTRAARRADARRAVMAELSSPGSSRRPPRRLPLPKSPLIHSEPARPERALATAAD